MHIPFEELEKVTHLKEVLHPSRLWRAATGSIRQWLDQRATPKFAHQAALRTFQPKIRFSIERHPYVVKTVESSWELESALRLRSRVFYEEMLGRRSASGLDMDTFDLRCDHLVIMDVRSSRCVGTYRLMASAYSDIFYSATEFDIRRLLSLPGVKLEVGRACIDKDYRTGAVIALLWAGIAQYLQKVGARYLFGCASVHTMDPVEIASISAYMKERGSVADELNLTPLSGHRPQDHGLLAASTALLSSSETRKKIPPLLTSYLRMGAKVSAEPAVDRDFHCVDYLTVLETSKLSASYERKFIRADN